MQFYWCPLLNKDLVFECCKVQVAVLRCFKLPNEFMPKPWWGLERGGGGFVCFFTSGGQINSLKEKKICFILNVSSMTMGSKIKFYKIEFENSIKRLSFFCCLLDIKIARIYPCLLYWFYVNLPPKNCIFSWTPMLNFFIIFNSIPSFNFFKKNIWFTPCKAEQPLRGMDLQEKEAQKD